MRVLANFGALRSEPDWHCRALPFALGLQRLFDLAQWQTIHDIIFCQPSFARNADAEPQILETLGAVSVGINYAFNSLFLDRKITRLNSSHSLTSRMPSSA